MKGEIIQLFRAENCKERYFKAFALENERSNIAFFLSYIESGKMVDYVIHCKGLCETTLSKTLIKKINNILTKFNKKILFFNDLEDLKDFLLNENVINHAIFKDLKLSNDKEARLLKRYRFINF